MELSQSTSECHLLKENAFGWSMEISWHCERETLLLIMFPDDVVQNRQVLLENFIQSWRNWLPWVWESECVCCCFPSEELKHISHPDTAARGPREKQVPCVQNLKGPCSGELYKKRYLWKWWQEPAPITQRAGCKAECSVRTFAFLISLFRGRTCLGALWKLLSLGPKPQWADYQYIGFPRLSVQLLASP